MALQLVSSTSTTMKMALIGLVVLILLVPLMMLRGMVQERAGLREQAFQKVAAAGAGPLLMGGPMLVVPTERTVVEASGSKLYRENLFILPQTLNTDVDLQQEAEPRYVGIYQVPVYVATLKLTGAFNLAQDMPDILARTSGTVLRWDQARLRLPMSDVRSLRKLATARAGVKNLAFASVNGGAYSGMEAAIRIDDPSQVPLAFHIELTMTGSREVSLLPLGGTTNVRMHSDWPAPSFQGAFLPAQRSINAQGFDATWQVLQLNRSFGQNWLESQFDATTLAAASFGVGLFQAVDIYQQTERAMKYALLFIALTFITFFAWEHLSKVRLHPMQYLFVGLALSIFYLLLIALSEQIPFAMAYWSAAAALVAVIGVYLAGALRKRQRGAAAAAAMTGIYGVLYALVLSESYALLMGAIVLFIALSAVMLLTRHVDWYAAGE